MVLFKQALGFANIRKLQFLKHNLPSLFLRLESLLYLPLLRPRPPFHLLLRICYETSTSSVVDKQVD